LVDQNIGRTFHSQAASRQTCCVVFESVQLKSSVEQAGAVLGAEFEVYSASIRLTRVQSRETVVLKVQVYFCLSLKRNLVFDNTDSSALAGGHAVFNCGVF